MKRFLFLVFTLLFIFPADYTEAHNPFTAAPEKQHKAPAPVIKSKFFLKIVIWQQQLREKMATLIRETKQTGRLTPFLILTVSAFAYGIIHSAGPGHGKAVALSYIFACRPSIRQGLLFGNILALTHGFSGIFLVLAVQYIFKTGISSSLESVTTVTQLISFSLIIILGLFIFLQSIFKFVQKKPKKETTPARLYSNPYLTAVLIGMVPCPGVVMVMLFGVSLHMTWLGILLGAFISLGMASTVSVIIMAGMSGKAATLAIASRYDKWMRFVELSIEAIAGILVALFGLALLSTAI